MNFGTWYLASTAGSKGDVEAKGSLHPLGAYELHRRLSAGAGSPAVVVDAGDFEKGLIDFDMLYGVLAHVKNLRGHVVVVDEKGPMSHFLGGIALADPIPVVRSLESAWELMVVLAHRAGPLASTPGSTVAAFPVAPMAPAPKRRAPMLHLLAAGSARRARRRAGTATLPQSA